MNQRLNISSFSILGVILIVLQGCAPSSYPIKQPTLSTNKFEAKVDKQLLKLTDNRVLDINSKFSEGTLKAELIFNGSAINEFQYLSDFTIKELKHRGIDVNNNEQSDINVNVETLTIKNHRTNGYTPFITFTMFKAKVKTPEGIKPIAAYIKRGKVPIWSFEELIEPTFNEPLSLLVQEFGAKLNQLIYKQKVSDVAVTDIINKVKNNLTKGETYLDVYQLGFSNNPTALPYLRELAQNSKREYIRSAAISSLGILKDTQSFEVLKEISKDARTWSDRAMAMKAIGDLGTNEGLSYLTSLKSKYAAGTSKEDKWNIELINLYID